MLRNLYSSGGGKQSASPASSLGTRCASSLWVFSVVFFVSVCKEFLAELQRFQAPVFFLAGGTSEGFFQRFSSFAGEEEGFSQLGALSLACNDRRLSVPVLDSLEGQGVGALGGGSLATGLSCPLFITSASLSGSDLSYQLLPVITQRDSFMRRGGGLAGQRGDRACSPIA